MERFLTLIILENVEVEELRKLNKQDLIEFYKTFISSKSNSRRKLAVYVNPSEMNSELTPDKLNVIFCYFFLFLL